MVGSRYLLRGASSEFSPLSDISRHSVNPKSKTCPKRPGSVQLTPRQRRIMDAGNQRL